MLTLIGLVYFSQLVSAADFGSFNSKEFAPRTSQQQQQRSFLSAPTIVQRALVSAVGYKQIRGSSQLGQTQISDSYNFRVRWFEPVFWGDNGAEGDTNGRRYNLQCWVESPGQESRWVLQTLVPASFTGYNEHYQFPQGMDVSVGCQIRAVNANGLEGPWRLTNKIRVLDVPIFLPGLEGTDLRGVTNEELARILARAAQKVASEGGGSSSP